MPDFQRLYEDVLSERERLLALVFVGQPGPHEPGVVITALMRVGWRVEGESWISPDGDRLTRADVMESPAAVAIRHLAAAVHHLTEGAVENCLTNTTLRIERAREVNMGQIIGPPRPEGEGWREGSWLTVRSRFWVRDVDGGDVEVFGEEGVRRASAAYWRAEGFDGWPSSEDDADPVQPPSAGGWAAGEDDELSSAADNQEDADIRADERRRIAAWLREEAASADAEACGAFNPRLVADAIERGAHGEVELDPEAIGATATPQRYVATGRETIDRQRDMAYFLAERMTAAVGGGGDPRIVSDFADVLFAFLCQAQVVRYMDRIGRKGLAAEDLAKAQWYEAMADHVMGAGPDPRASRPDFVPYVRHPWGGQ